MDWYVARTKPGKEQRAATGLAQLQVDVYLPILRKDKPRAGRRGWEPLFPGYLFASFDPTSNRWRAARSAPNVAYFLGQEGHPSPLPDDFIPALKAHTERTNGGRGLSCFSAGQRVIITHGPFEYMEAVFDRRLSASGRSRVLLQLLHRLVPLDLPTEHLKSAV
jgi:transcriptional antiterminator RfaH